MNHGLLARILYATYLAALFLFLFAPIAVVVVFAFDAKGIATPPFEGPTLRWFRAVLADPVLQQAAANSAKIAVITVILCILIGTPAAFAIARLNGRGVRAFALVISMPLMLPTLLVGVTLMAMFSSLGVGLSMWTATVGHVLVTLPFLVFTLSARITSIDPQLAEAAANLGATPAQTFRRITLPLIGSALACAGLLVLGWSIDEFTVSFFNMGGGSTLPMAIWGQMRGGVSPTVNAISTIMLGLTVFIILVVHRLGNIAALGGKTG
ncbi:MAG: hypothetical protein CFE34_00970 [Rhodobacteraceae bacterium PARR1]|nr:MAG: hypothetical protein CFE34_00970 [Rhodobacteraceae bacterium PARR1]